MADGQRRAVFREPLSRQDLVSDQGVPSLLLGKRALAPLQRAGDASAAGSPGRWWCFSRREPHRAASADGPSRRRTHRASGASDATHGRSFGKCRWGRVPTDPVSLLARGTSTPSLARNRHRKGCAPDRGLAARSMRCNRGAPFRASASSVQTRPRPLRRWIHLQSRHGRRARARVHAGPPARYCGR